MFRARLCAALTSLAIAPVVFADHEEVLIYPASVIVLVFVAIGVVLVPWHRWWVRVITAIVLLSANAALWSVDLGARADYDLDRMLAIMIVVPCAVATVAGALLWKLVRRSR